MLEWLRTTLNSKHKRGHEIDHLAKQKEENKQSELPVSAFFLLDSVDAIERCRRAVISLTDCSLDSENDRAFFDTVRQKILSRSQLLNYDHLFSTEWHGRTLQVVLRVHSVDAETYEVELWLPGVVANDRESEFGDGKEAFFCAFMPPAFYD